MPEQLMPAFVKWNQWITKHLFILVLVAMICGYFTAIERSTLTSMMIALLFAYITFIGSLSSSLQEFLGVLKKPWKAIWILMLLHIAVPLFSWGVGFLAFPDAFNTRMGLLIAATIPIAVSSLMWITITGGNLSLTLVAITFDTLITPLFMPLFFYVLFGQSVHLNYWSMIGELMLIITIPSLMGMVMHDVTRNRFSAFVNSVGAMTSKIAMFLIIVLNTGGIAHLIIWDTRLIRLLLVILFLVCSGYIIGFLGWLPLRKDGRKTMICFVYNVGMRNIAFGSVLAFAYFPLETVLPVTLFSLFQQPVAGIVSALLERSEKKEAAHGLDT
ncbi:MAG: bile acid:sodium symporter family protein [Peptococcaceae bacterium]|nr:bile acid:sodium symporter family protein [Peptococcaceae bacterium]